MLKRILKSFTALALFAALSLASAGPAFAEPKHYELFDPFGNFSSDYNQIFAKLKPGDILDFQDGNSFIFEESINNGNTTRILGVTPVNGTQFPAKRLALRVPISKDIKNWQYIEATHQGYAILKESNLPVVDVFQHYSHEYVLVERVKIDFTFEEFLGKLPDDLAHPDKVTQEFLDFAKKTAPFKRIGDLHPGQIAYIEGRGWTILDWTTSTTLFKPSERSLFRTDNAFQNFGWVLDQIKAPEVLRNNWDRLYFHVNGVIQATRDAEEDARLLKNKRPGSLGIHDSPTWKDKAKTWAPNRTSGRDCVRDNISTLSGQLDGGFID